MPATRHDDVYASFLRFAAADAFAALRRLMLRYAPP